MPRVRPPHVRTSPDVMVPLTLDECRTVLAVLADVARREREQAAELYRPRQVALIQALAEKQTFADECERIGDRVRAALESR